MTSSSADSTAAHAGQGSPPKRRIRNYLLNPKFQLKYTAMICGVALVLTTGLSAVVFRNANAARIQSTAAVSQAERAFRESKTSAEVLQQNALMNAGDNPELIAQINGDLRRAESELTTKLAEARHSREEIERNYTRTRLTLLLGGALLVLLLGLSGVVITHKVVGPVFKMKRLLRKVGAGKLDIRERLRKGDELEDLFEAFMDMVTALKKTQTDEIAQLEAAIADAKTAGAPASAIEKLETLRDRMKATVGESASS
jgi:nitrate/nitrite-specific signal transduction histidine kinase